MKIKRALFIGSLIVLFIFCFYKMNEQYDELARYPFSLSDEEREIVLNHLDTEGINYLVEQKIKPDQILPYIEDEDFELTNTLWYDKAYHIQKEETSFVIAFINKYRKQINYADLDMLLTNYSYNLLMRFYDDGDIFADGKTLISNPNDILTLINENNTLYLYEPTDLVSINDLPHNTSIAGNNIAVRKEVVKPLHDLANAMEEINHKPFGNMEIVTSYLSYEQQYMLYDKVEKKYKEDLNLYWDVPGCSEYQLGYSIQLMPKLKSDKKVKENEVYENVIDSKKEEMKEQAIWLKDNAYKYGFIVRYPKSKEEITNKKYQPYTLRYVGKELAQYIYENNIVLEEIDKNK